MSSAEEFLSRQIDTPRDWVGVPFQKTKQQRAVLPDRMREYAADPDILYTESLDEYLGGMFDSPQLKQAESAKEDGDPLGDQKINAISSSYKIITLLQDCLGYRLTWLNIKYSEDDIHTAAREVRLAEQWLEQARSEAISGQLDEARYRLYQAR
jgi:hypothetical protein